MPAHGFSHLTVRKKNRSFTGPRSASNGPTYRKARPKPRPDPSGGRGTVPPRGSPKPRGPFPTGPKPKGPNPTAPKPKRKAAVDYVMERRKKKGAAVTRGQARKIVKKNTRADRKNRAYKYDFAGDGAHKNDKDYGTKANNRARKKAGFSPVKKNRKDHGGGNGNNGTKVDNTQSADDAGNSQSGDSYGGPQSLSSAERLSMKREAKEKARKRRQRRRDH